MEILLKIGQKMCQTTNLFEISMKALKKVKFWVQKSL